MSNDIKYSFEKLTPINDSDISVYEAAVDYVFENSDVKNIAISGAYGAGKSSLVETYKNKHKDYKFVHVSLAHFETNEESEEPLKNTVLEGKILNQILHQIPSNKIPQTKFRIKKTIDPKAIFWQSIAIISLLLCIIHNVFFGDWCAFVKHITVCGVKDILKLTTHHNSLLITGAIAIILTSLFVWQIVKAQKNKNIFKKLSFQGNEIEIFEESQESYFDKYLNEVLYIFENIDADVIVFEDMDRHEVNSIFERLREINTLVNLNRNDTKPLRFFYLLRDDIFVSKDRTKFFDCIIPVVPIIDSSNSYDQFRVHLTKNKLLDRFDDSFIKGVSLYVDDMRLLKNICNEFIIYYSRLNTTELDCNKMLAIIIYKNLFPRDFSALQLNQGFVFALFDSKEQIIKNELDILETKLEEKNKELEENQKENLVSVEELDMLHKAKKDKVSTAYGTERTKLQKEVEDWYSNEYPKRKIIIESKNKGANSIISDEINDIEKQITKITVQPLHKLITRENIDVVFSLTTKNMIGTVESFNDVKSNEYFDLLKYLIRNGYIDENYADYMTYFYGQGLSRTDKIFLRSVTDKNAKEYSYVLNNAEKVFNHLNESDFEQEETLNFDMFEWLLHNVNNEKANSCLINMFAQLSKTKNIDFVMKFYEIKECMPEFIKTINQKWGSFIAVLLGDESQNEKTVRKYVIDTLYNSNSFINYDSRISLRQYVSNSPDFLNIDNPIIDNIIKKFKQLEIKFEKIDYNCSNKDLFNEVYKNSLYTINIDNVSLMLTTQFDIEDQSTIIHRSNTIIQNSADSPLSIYIKENFDEFIHVLLNNCDGQIQDDPNIAIETLNNKLLDNETKSEYISYLDTSIEDINDVEEKTLWRDLIENSIVIVSIHNIVMYFNEFSLDTTLVNYINKSDNTIDFSSVSENYGKDVANKLFSKIRSCNEIETNIYEKALCDLNYYIGSFNTENISDDKIAVLINNSIIRMNSDTLTFIRKSYPGHVLEYIKKNIKEYVELIDEDLFDIDEIIKVLKLNVGDSLKKDLISISDENIPLSTNDFSDSITAYIIQNKLDEDDKSYLFKNYSKYGSITKPVIESLAVVNCDEIISESLSIDIKLLSILLKNDNIEYDDKVSLLANTIPNLSTLQCITHLEELRLSELAQVFQHDGYRKRYEKNPRSTKILKAFQRNGWIENFHVDSRTNKYVIAKKKSRK